MPNFLWPGIYVQEMPGGPRPIEAVGTSTAAFVGEAPDPKAFPNEPRAINNWEEFRKEFVSEGGVSTPLSHAVFGFFNNGGSRCYVVNVAKQPVNAGLAALEAVDDVEIVAIPGCTDIASYEAALTHCENLKDRVAILDASLDVKDIDLLTKVAAAPLPAKAAKSGEGSSAPSAPAPTGLRPRVSDGGYGAFYFPWLVVADPLSPKNVVTVPPSGHLAGIWARTDAEVGVHKAPANTPVRGALNLTYRLTNAEQGELNQMGVNCIRYFGREGILVWGARTLADSASEWRYLNVRRLCNMIEKSIADGTRWVVFQPNNVSLWKEIRADVTHFLTQVHRDGGLMGATPQQAFFVKCDAESNPPDVVEAGKVVTIIGLAPVYPAEFVVFQIVQSLAAA
jgi:phage tail sheath protein FI